MFTELFAKRTPMVANTPRIFAPYSISANILRLIVGSTSSLKAQDAKLSLAYLLNKSRVFDASENNHRGRVYEY